MNINTFINSNALKPADAIVVKKIGIGLLKHYIIYLGVFGGHHRFMANYTKGIQIISFEELGKFLNQYSPVQLNRFKGNAFEREEALERAWSRRGEREYDLILNNCEHYKNFVHYGYQKSDQVENLGIGLVAAGSAIAVGGAANKNDNSVIGGLVLAGLGLVTLLMENENK